MRILRSSPGVALLALALALGGVGVPPAQAADGESDGRVPGTLSAAAGTTEPGTTEPGTAEPGTAEPGTSEPGPPGTEPPGDPAPDGDPATGDPDPDPGPADPRPTEPAVPGPADPVPGAEPVAADPAAEDPAARLLGALPEALPLDGTVVVVAAEGGSAPVAEDTPAAAAPLAEEQRLIATDVGPILELPVDGLAAAAAGERVTGELVLDPAPEQQAAVATEAVAALAPEDLPAATQPEPPPTEAGTEERARNEPLTGEPLTGEPTATELTADALSNDALSPDELSPEATAAVTVAALNLGGNVTIGGLVIPGSGTGSGTAPRAHTADVAFYTGGGAPSTAELTQLVRDAGDYWAGQTNGAVSGITVNAVKRVATFAGDRAARCDPKYLQRLWSDAAQQFGRSTSSYIGSARHLIVLVDDGCGALSQHSSGWGSYGTLHSGGLSWVDLGARHRAGLPLSAATGMVAHEIGHNLGLGHGKSRVCSGSATDAAVRGGAPVAPCADVEYGDPFNVMGIGAWSGGRRPPALTAAQRDALGVAPTGAIRAVRASGGATQTITLAAAGSATGVRGLRIEGDRGGTFYVEYRAMTGQDASMGLAAGRVYATGLAPGEHYTAAGVRIVKGDADSGRNADGTHRFGSTVVSVRDAQLGATGLFQTARAGRTASPWNSSVRVSVVSTSAASARVKIEFMPFTDVQFSRANATQIAWMHTSGYFTGTSVGGGKREFRPTKNVTRAELASMMYRLAAPKRYTPPKKSPFVDVPTSHPSYRQIAWSYSAGLTPGTVTKGRRTFAPTATVSRESFAVQLYSLRKSRYAGAAKSPFIDVKKGSASYKQISWMYASGLAPGTITGGKRSFAPRYAVTREAAAVAFYALTH